MRFLIWCLICFLFSFSVGTHIRSFDRELPSSKINVSSCEGGLTEFQHIIFENGSIYVGATNTILQLTPDLIISHQFISGPGNDSDTCSAPLVCGTVSQVCAGSVSCNDNFNTLLLAYRGRLLACGTLYAACDVLTLNDISIRFGNELDLKCLDILLSASQKYLTVSNRIPDRRLVGSIHVNKTQFDHDILYLGKFHENIKTLLVPNLSLTYFTVIEESNTYVPENRMPVYHFSWTNNDYGYILWTTSSTAAPQLKLSRYCNRIVSELTRSEVETSTELNNGERSYTEITLQCNVSGEVLTDLISAKVYFNKLFLLYQSNNLVIICSSNVSTLNERFNFIREQCWNVNDSPLVKPIDETKSCDGPQSEYNEDWSTCGIPKAYSRFLTPVEATTPLFLNNDLKLSLQPEQSATGFVIVQANDLISSFIGTSSGNILKVRLGVNDLISETISAIPSSPILNSMVTDDNGEQLFSAVKDLVFSVSVANCSQYTTCEQCLESQDIYCGWCVLESRCTRKNSCDASDQTDRWIKPTSNSNLCPRISDLQPNNVSHDSGQTAVNIVLSGTNLQSNLSYNCQFVVDGSTTNFPSSSLQWSSGGTFTGSCQFDPVSADVIPAGSDHSNVTLNIVYDGRAVVSTTLQVFSCSRVKELNPNTVCTSCSSSQWGCSWCTSTASCGYNPSCNQPIIEPSGCPRVTSINDVMSPISVGKSNTFTLNTENIFQPFSEYNCRYMFCEKTISSSAIVSSPTVAKCTVPGNELSCDVSNTSILVFLERNDNYVIDTSSISSIQGTIFNCSVNTRSCGSCMAFRQHFNQCGWCPSTLSCSAETKCSERAINISFCSTGNIHKISPVNGPLQGGTEITITGTNLGSVVGDISNVTVGTVNCSVVADLYVPSKKVVCRTNMASSESAGGNVTIYTTYGSPIRSSFVFHFKSVAVSSYSPHVVINQSLITVNGSNLDVGTKAILSYGNTSITSVDCYDRSSDSFACRIGQHPAGKTQLSFSIDDFSHNFSSLLEFVLLPTLSNYTPAPIKVFSGAGKAIEIPLSSTSGLQKVELEVNQRKTLCKILAMPPSVSCQVPTEKQSSSRRKRRQTANDANLVLNDEHRINIGSIQYQPNPSLSATGVILPCETNTSTTVNSTLASVQIPGKNFADDVVSSDDVKVTLIPVTTDPPYPVIDCDVVNIIEDSVIFCRVRLSEWNMYRNLETRINVTIENLNLTTSSKCENPDNIVIIAVVCAAAVIFILIILIIILIWLQRKKRLQQEEERKLILQKLDDLENKTRETARNAYYELQLGYMDNLEGNLTQRIIYLPPELYFTQTLFNLSRGHPILDKAALKNESSLRLEAIRDWTKLLRNREFLMIFIRTLEEQKRFTVQEKGHVASLLTVCLISDMPYFTNIMFDLLTELIQKHVQKNPKLLLRRSESVVEKMVSHWLSITLYDECIMEKSGEPIFLLTKAVHFLVSSGPNDVVEHKSLNSLNESTLLSSEISFDGKVLLASIQDEETEKITSPVEVNVVDVDTITQIKGKIIEAIYRDKPYSEYPKPDDLDLVLSGENTKEGITLSDIDSTSVVEGPYKKINTLKHYNIPEKTRVLLRPKSFSNPASPTAQTPLLNGRKSQMYHLIHPKDEESQGYRDVENGGGKKTKAVLQGLINKPLQEIYLTRMVRSKTTIQGYVDKVFSSVLSPEPIPFAIRYFFQFLDREAARHRINDAEVIHIWKTNSLLLRYWVNVLKNPEFIFDINKTVIVDSCLNVITQAFMDACATTTRKLGHDSPSNKLLYAKESQQYKKMVKEFFVKVSNTPWMDDEEINRVLVKTSQQHAEKFNQDVASQQLFQYLFKYRDQIVDAVRDDGQEDVAQNIESVMGKMEDKAQTTLV